MLTVRSKAILKVVYALLGEILTPDLIEDENEIIEVVEVIKDLLYRVKVIENK